MCTGTVDWEMVVVHGVDFGAGFCGTGTLPKGALKSRVKTWQMGGWAGQIVLQ
jgi:hypothetical protein